MSTIGSEARRVLVTGTGTGIGKTHISEALLRAAGARGLRTAGLKPIETGVTGGATTDAARLAAASTFHVKHSAYAFPAPLSPHLAAREAGAPPIQSETIRAFVAAPESHADFLLVELAGGLFTPVTDTLFNADLAADLAPDATLLIAPDRLGVLHDVFAALRAASTVPLRIDAILLSAPETPDSSTGRNAAEILRLSPRTPVFELPRTDVTTLAQHPALRALLEQLGSPVG